MTLRPISTEGLDPVIANPGPLPVLTWVRLDQMVIDDSYQRPLQDQNWKLIAEIAAAFDWSRFGAAMVAPAVGSTAGRPLYALIDGQHRVHAAALCGLEEVPALVSDIGPGDQARAFAAINGRVARINAFNLFKAALAAGEGWAVAADAAVSDAGCKLMTSNYSSRDRKPAQVYAVVFIRRAIEAGRAWAVTAGLGALRAVPSLQRPVAYSDFIIRPWVLAVGDSGCRDRALLAQVLARHDPFKVIERAGGAGPGRNTFRALIAQEVSRAA
jgi:hypothetical protein